MRRPLRKTQEPFQKYRTFTLKKRIWNNGNIGIAKNLPNTFATQNPKLHKRTENHVGNGEWCGLECREQNVWELVQQSLLQFKSLCGIDFEFACRDDSRRRAAVKTRRGRSAKFEYCFLFFVNSYRIETNNQNDSTHDNQANQRSCHSAGDNSFVYGEGGARGFLFCVLHVIA